MSKIEPRSFLDSPLAKKNQEEILERLLGLQFDSEGNLIDGDGFVFCGFNPDSPFDFTTLRGIIKYLMEESISKGIRQNQASIKSVLGI